MDIWEVEYILLSDLIDMFNFQHPRIYTDVLFLIANIQNMAEQALSHWLSVEVYLNEKPMNKIIRTLEETYPDDVVVIRNTKIEYIIDSLDPDVLEAKE